MNTLFNAQRRLTVKFLAALGIGTFCDSAISKVTTLRTLPNSEAATKICSAFRTEDALLNLGNAYIKQEKRIKSTAYYLDKLCEKLEMTLSEFMLTRPQSLRLSLRKAIGNDYAEGKVVKLRGWVLSEAEIQACVVVALTRPE